MFAKSISYFFLGLALLVSLALVILRPTPEFNYDFDQFFPQQDPDLDFYQEFKRTFENDNDYLLFAINNGGEDWLDSSFLAKSIKLQQSIELLDGVDSVISILNLKKPIIGVFGIREIQVLNWSSEAKLKRTSDDLSIYRSGLISEDGEAFLLWIKNEQNISKEKGDQVYESIQTEFRKIGIVPLAVAGKIQAQGDFVKLMQSEFGLFLGLSFILILLVLTLIYRNWTAVLIPVIVLAVGVAWAFAWIILSGRSLDVMSIMQPTIFLIVGMSALVHFFTHLSNELRINKKELAIRSVFKSLAIPVGLTILTTGLGFISLYFTTIPALKSFGLTTGVGIFVVFFAVIGITPGLLHLLPVKFPRANQSKARPFLLGVLTWVFHQKKKIALGFLGLSALCILLGTQVKINGFLLDSLPKDHPIQADLNYFDAQFGGSNPLEISIQAQSTEVNLLSFQALQEIHKVEEKMNELFGQREFVSPVALAKILNQAQNQGNVDAYVFPSPAQYQRMSRWINRASKEYEGRMISPDLMTARISGRLPDLGSLEMQKRREALEQFVAEEVDENLIEVRWTGTAYLIDKGHESVTWQMGRGLFVAFLLVGLIAGFLFKSWRISLILLIPNLFPLFMMLGLMYMLGVEFKLSTAILFSVAFGIAVDDSIHFMTRLKFELGQGKNLLYAIKRTFLETGFAIALTTLVLVSGFGLLIFSQFEVTYFTGLLISASLIFALLADLVLLPVLLLPMKKVWEAKNPENLEE